MTSNVFYIHSATAGLAATWGVGENLKMSVAAIREGWRWGYPDTRGGSEGNKRQHSISPIVELLLDLFLPRAVLRHTDSQICSLSLSLSLAYDAQGFFFLFPAHLRSQRYAKIATPTIDA